MSFPLKKLTGFSCKIPTFRVELDRFPGMVLNENFNAEGVKLVLASFDVVRLLIGDTPSGLLSTPNLGGHLTNRTSPNRKLKEATDRVSGKLRAYAHKLKKDQDQQQQQQQPAPISSTLSRSSSNSYVRSSSVNTSSSYGAPSFCQKTHKRSLSLVNSESKKHNSIAEEPMGESQAALQSDPGAVLHSTSLVSTDKISPCEFFIMLVVYKRGVRSSPNSRRNEHFNLPKHPI